MALVLVALLVLCNQALVQPSLTRLATDAPLLNVAGRQRMLSQRLAKAALALERQGAEGGDERLAELGEVLSLWSASHERLRQGGAAAGWTTENSRAVEGVLGELTPSFERMRDAAVRLLRDGVHADAGPAAARADLSVILANEAEYLRTMDRVVALYEREARGRVEHLRRIGWALTGATLVALAAIGRLILRPAVTLIRSQVAELGRARDELEARVLERTRELESARVRHRELLDQLGRAGRSSSIGETATSLAHELNQPLGAIANYAEGCLIELNAPRPDLDAVRGALGRLLATTMRAGQVIERVRRFVTRQVPACEDFEATPLVRAVVEILGPEARGRGVAVTLDLAPALPLLRGDPVQIQQALLNLVRNAFEALNGPQSVAPSVVIWTRRAGGGGVEFGVKDSGEGIPAERADRVFDAYFSTRADGMGMGLAISRTIVEAHQGRIRVESEPGVGTTFRLQIPATVDGDEGDAAADDLHRGR